MIRSILSVVAGYLTFVVGVSAVFAFTLTIGYGGMPPAEGFVPPGWLYVVEIVSAPLVAFAGGWVCAFVARRKELQHAAALVGVMTVLGIVSAVFDAGDKAWWSSVLIVVLGVLGTFAGAALRARQTVGGRR